MKIKYAKDIAKEIRERGSVQVPEGCIAGDAFEEWLRDRSNFKMGIIEQAKELRTIANNLSIGHNIPISLAIERFRQAADTIEALSAKLAAANMERSDRYCGGGWISCKDRTPDKQGLYIIHVITGTGEDYVGTWIYQQGVHLSGRQTYIDDKQGYWASPYSGDPVNEYLTQNFIAWQSMPEPYRP